MPGPNTVSAVVSIMRRLCDGGAPCLLLGGWAEEAFGLCQPRAHGDIDLLLPAASFRTLDRLIAAVDDLDEIALKRFAHKRAFLVDGLMVEVVLVQQEDGAAVTWFWGDVRFAWLAPLADDCLLGGQRLPAASRENLQRFRALHRSTEPWRWRDRTSLVSPTAISLLTSGCQE